MFLVDYENTSIFRNSKFQPLSWEDSNGVKESKDFNEQTPERHLSEVKPKPITTHQHAFSRHCRRLHVFTMSFDWLTVLSFVIG